MRRAGIAVLFIIICSLLTSAAALRSENIQTGQKNNSLSNKTKKNSGHHKKNKTGGKKKLHSSNTLKQKYPEEAALSKNFVPVHSKFSDIDKDRSGHPGGKEESDLNDKPQIFAQMQRAIRTAYGKDKPEYPPNYRIEELLKARSIENTRSLSKASSAKKLDWKERGPANIGGRTRTVIADPSDPSQNTWLAGSAGGGIWKTADAGKTWTNLTPNLANLATSTLAIPEAHPEIIYAGTGELSNNSDMINGSGIWKSTDRGLSWEQLKSTAYSPDFRNVSRIIVDPNNPDLVIASTTPGFWTGASSSYILRSIDGGTSWKKVYSSAHDIEQILANPKNFNTQYATVNSVGVVRSFDGGISWQPAGTGLNGLRMEMDVSPADTSRLFISAQKEEDFGFGTGGLLYTSRNSGYTWQKIPITNYDGLDFLYQGWYDNTIAADIYDVNRIYVGGTNLWQFNLRDSTFNSISSVELSNTEAFLSFSDYGLPFNGGGIGLGTEFNHKPTGINDIDFVNAEVRFGPGKSQFAYRFYDGIDGEMEYQDYVKVPFEVWDTDHNRQLMVSFRDFDKDGTWNPKGPFSQEFIFINSVQYDITPDKNIASTGGTLYKNLYVICPATPFGHVFDPNDFPIAAIKINYGKTVATFSKAISIADAYNWYGGKNHDVHPDHHCIRILPLNPGQQGSFRILDANDGGVWYSDDEGESFLNTLNGFNTTQFYGVDKKNGANEYTGGMQDNGSGFSPKGTDAGASANWLPSTGGDGFEAVWKYDDPDKMISTIYNNTIFRTTNGGADWFESASSSGLTETSSSNSPFITRVAKSNQDPDLLFALSRSGVWRSEDFAESWHLTMLPFNWGGEGIFSNVKISLVNPQVVWAGEAMTSDRPLFVSTDGGRSFNPALLYHGENLGIISGLATHPSDDKTAYALFSFAHSPKILRTTDLGKSWEDISGFSSGSPGKNGFPDVAVFSLLVMPYNTSIIWAGTEIGLFESTDNGLSWHYADNGLPAVCVYDMKIVNDQVVVATHGRGVWSVSLPELQGYTPPKAVLSPRFVKIGGGGNGVFTSTLRLSSAYDSTFVVNGKDKILKIPTNSESLDTALTFIVNPHFSGPAASISLVSYRQGALYYSSAHQLKIYELLSPQTAYFNDFNNSTANNDFIEDGLSIHVTDGFNDAAIHSPHNYPDQSNLTATLKVPIIVAASGATISYDDIAIVEPGEEGSVYGSPDFYDYVVVEGSNDFGATWKPLANGYDANYDPKWLESFKNTSAPAPSMFRNHSLDLLNTFRPGEQIMIRFRLFSDSFTNGWGWVIDNLKIQENATGIASAINIPSSFSLEQNYPNPFNPVTTIRFSIPKEINVTLGIFDAIGRKITTLVDKKMTPGVYDLKWNASSFPSGIYLYRLEAGGFVETRKLLLLK